MPPLPSTTIIVATTPPPTLGIGKSLNLPWPRLPLEMSYFARVTKHVPPLPPSSHSQTSPSSSTFINAVIMGRKTYESIPSRFRPLPERINVVISRNPPSVSPQPDNSKNEFWTSSITSALQLLQEVFKQGEKRVLHRVYVIGGAEIYKLALNLQHQQTEEGGEGGGKVERILQTTILEPEFECDTFFPDVNNEGGGGWREAGLEELVEFTGEEEDVVSGVKEEKGVKYKFGMLVR